MNRFHSGKFPETLEKKSNLKGKPFAKHNGTYYKQSEMGPLLPVQNLQPYVAISLYFHKSNTKDLFELIKEYNDSIVRIDKIKSIQIDTTNYKRNMRIIQFWIKQQICIRFTLRKFIQQRLYKRYKNKLLNTEDPITLVEPIKPIKVFDVNARGNYVFEASSLKKSMETELTYADWMFPEPMRPKNPLTNLPFRRGQLLHILLQLRSLGFYSWILEAYRGVHYNILEFRDQFMVPLKLRSLDDIVKNPIGEELQELLTEFIEDHYEYHEIEFRSHLTILKWAAKNMLSDPYMKKWVQSFKKFYKLQIIYGKHYLDDNDNLHDIYYDQTMSLLNDSSSIARLGKLRLESLPKPSPKLTPVRVPEEILDVTQLINVLNTVYFGI